ncbi:hypothetical protein PFISCL1PPCAC_808, partial [Pristionchus fissidentatus]
LMKVLFLIVSVLASTVSSITSPCISVVPPAEGFSYAEQYIRGNYSDETGAEHILSSGSSSGDNWTLEYTITYGAFQANTIFCPAECMYQLVGYSKQYNGTYTRTVMKQIDALLKTVHDPNGLYTEYDTVSSMAQEMNPFYCARQAGYCG